MKNKTNIASAPLASVEIPEIPEIKTRQSVNKRIEILVLHLCKGRQKAFADRIGLSAQNLHAVIGVRQTRPGSEILEKIADAFSDVNPDWLLTGNGAMLRETDSKDFGRDVVERLQLEIKREREEKRMILRQNQSLLELLGKQSDNLCALLAAGGIFFAPGLSPTRIQPAPVAA